MLTTIVVGYDGSDTALKAVAEAAALASATSAELHLVNVVDNEAMRHGLTLAEQEASVAEHAEAANKRLLAGEAGISLDGINVVNHVTSGAAADTLLGYAADSGADLIVVGNKRVQGIQRLLGSVAVEVLRRSSCSVYVAHTSA